MSPSRLVSLSMLFSSLAMAGCGTRVDYTPLRGPTACMTPRSPSQVEVFLTQKPPRPYVEVGLLEARQESEMSLDGQSAIIEELRQEAAEIGCDGLIVTGDADQVTGHADKNGGYVTELKGYRAVCIVWAAPSSC
jgi:hypothetical protein